MNLMEISWIYGYLYFDAGIVNTLGRFVLKNVQQVSSILIGSVSLIN